MGEYVPLYKPGQTITSQASATITGGQLVAVSGVGTVGPAGAASTAVIGVAAFDVVNGDKLTIHVGGVQRLLPTSTVTAGDPVIAGAAGAIVTAAAPPLGQQVGVALTTATQPALAEVFMVR